MQALCGDICGRRAIRDSLSKYLDSDENTKACGVTSYVDLTESYEIRNL